MELIEGKIVADRFRLLRPLGQGGMGSVWLAHHITLDVPCALKFVHADAASVDEVRARFEREARAAAKLRSPHIVQILDHGEWEGLPYIAMEALEGEDLAQRLERRKTLSPAETAAILGQVARALGKAHAAGLIHRDLKPANIFLVRDDDREIAKVLDFGIAKSTSAFAQSGSLETRSGAVLGTPVYMSPEQAQGIKTVDHRSDLWALAVVAFECLTGRLPFESTALGDLFVKIITRPSPVPSSFGPVPRGFDAFWKRASEKEPADRYQSAKELADALSIALGQPVDAAPVGLAPRESIPSNPSSPGSPALTLSDAVTENLARSAAPSKGAGWIVGVALGIAVAGGVAFFALRDRGPAQPEAATQQASSSRPLPEPPAPSPSASAAPVPTVEPALAPPLEIASSAVSAALPPGKPPAARPSGAPAPSSGKPPKKPRYDDGI